MRAENQYVKKVRAGAVSKAEDTVNWINLYEIQLIEYFKNKGVKTGKNWKI